jgi:hypothetical protein
MYQPGPQESKASVLALFLAREKSYACAGGRRKARMSMSGEDRAMARREQHSNRKAKKPKKEKPKAIAAAPSIKRLVASAASSELQKH